MHQCCPCNSLLVGGICVGRGSKSIPASLPHAVPVNETTIWAFRIVNFILYQYFEWSCFLTVTGQKNPTESDPQTKVLTNLCNILTAFCLVTLHVSTFDPHCCGAWPVWCFSIQRGGPAWHEMWKWIMNIWERETQMCEKYAKLFGPCNVGFSSHTNPFG